jgi:hypothetical protein
MVKPASPNTPSSFSESTWFLAQPRVASHTEGATGMRRV